MWESKHIFIHDYQLLDEFLKDELFPLTKEFRLDEWFYIRYWQGGPHIRLRYKIVADNHKQQFEDQLAERLTAFKNKYSHHSFERVEYDDRITKLENVSDLAIYPNFSIQTVPYVAEWDRYGGEAAIQYSEKIFSKSSNLARYIIEQVDWPKRYMIAFDLMYHSYKTAEKLRLIQSQAAFFGSYNNVWKAFERKDTHGPVIEGLTRRLSKISAQDSVPEVYVEYLQAVEQEFENISQSQTTYSTENLFYVMVSHIHMLNNRLGISPENEHLLSSIFLMERECLSESLEF
ncbi:lantibiotic dehydratase C-terminal domain-containing protein [Sporosarcina sp. NPDC096371]|uniref:lantibiotic dehydratase C-terminal domain-containing protein n=1 Tax=Sporosarcina sp. NPDC096371 TaxID=3364530 RepID=UPI00380396B3